MSGPLTAAHARALVKQFLAERGYRVATCRRISCLLEFFYRHLEQVDVGAAGDLRQVDRETILGYLQALNEHVSARTGRPLAPGTRRQHFAAVRLLFQALAQHQLILTNPTHELRYRPSGPQQPRTSLSVAQMARLLESIDVEQPLGLRDRAIFELMYSSALRAGELARLTLADLDLTRRLLIVRLGKWTKDRVVPFSQLAALFLGKWLAVRGSAPGPLFLGAWRGGLSGAAINRRFKAHLARCGLQRPGLTAHSIRHAAATHLLAGGADLRYVQQLLGHDSIQSTVTYTHELHDNLRRLYKTHHPRENQLFCEVDDEYLQRLERLRSQLARQRARRPRHSDHGLSHNRLSSTINHHEHD